MTSSTKQLIVFVLIVAGVVWFFRSGSGGGSFDGEAPPALEAAGFLNAEAMPTLAGAKGSKVVLVEFWATW
ncbi:MAG: hypothetical protein ACYS22_18080, partial [Planctomycetota bacterium]